jgi:hypothetical protein
MKHINIFRISNEIGIVIIITITFICNTSFAQVRFSSDSDVTAKALFVPPKEGEDVDLAHWAYNYQKGSDKNPSETEWLWADKMITLEGPMTRFRKTDALETLCPKEKVLCGVIFEETVSGIERIELEFPETDEPLPSPNEIVVSYSRGTMWSCDPGTLGQIYPGGFGALPAWEPKKMPDGTTTYTYYIC